MSIARNFALSFAVLTCALRGQSIPNTATVPVSVDSGLLTNATGSIASVWSETVHVPAAATMRLRFDVAQLAGPLDAIVVTNPLDGQVHRLDGRGLMEWEGTSGWFNGNALHVSLVLGPQSAGRVSVGGAMVQVAPLLPETVCFTDDRTLSIDQRVVRLIINTNQGANRCTGFVISGATTVLSAGHFFAGFTGLSVVAERNVPLSTSSGIILHPAIVNQFPAQNSSFQFNSQGPGLDWAVGRFFPNVNGDPIGLVGSYPFASLGSGPFNCSVTGFGQDSTPDLTRNEVQQTATGSVSAGSGTILNHDVDTEAGSDGSPILVSTIFGTTAVGIHTSGGCTQSGGTNRGTSATSTPLSLAIASVNGCASFHLTNVGSISTSCSDAVFSCAPVAGRWNVVGVSSPSDWDIAFGNVQSVFANDVCDYLVTNGHNGTIPPTIGRITRFGGSAPGQAQFSAAQVVPMNQTGARPWTTSTVLSAFEFEVTTAGSYDLNVAGDPSLRWALYSPAVVSTWAPRSTQVLVDRAMGAPTTIALNPGFHCVVIYRNGGPAQFLSADSVALSVCQSHPPLALSAGIPQVTTSACEAFTLSPTAGVWNAVAVGSADDWDLTLGAADGSNPAPTTEFAAADGHNGFPTPTAGLITRQSGSGPATIELASATSLGSGGYILTSMPAGHLIRVFEVSTSVTVGYELTTAGDPSLKWYLLASLGSGFEGATQVVQSGTVGDGGGNVTLVTTGGVVRTMGLAIVRQGAPATSDLPLTIRLADSSTHVTLSGPGATATVSNTPASHAFTCAPVAGKWNALAITGSTLAINSGFGLAIGTGGSFATDTSAVLANGHLGAISSTEGIVYNNSATHTSATLLESGITTLSVGSLGGTAAFATFPRVHVFEFEVTFPGLFDIAVSGPTGYAWSLFKPGTSSEWRSRTTADLSAGFGTQQGVLLQPGWHAVLVRRGSGTVSGATASVTVTPQSQPAPTLASVSPNSTGAGSADLGVTLTGTGFNALTSVRWDGATALAITSLSPTTIVATIPAALIATPGAHTLRVTNPLPGGGTSSTVPFTVLAPTPILVQVTPDHVIAGSTNVTLTVLVSPATPVFPGSAVRLNSAFLPTTFVDSTTLTAQVGALLILSPTTAAVTVIAASPGGGISASLPLFVEAPAITTTSPATLPLMTAASPSVDVTLTGARFLPGAVVHAGVTTLPTTFVSATQLVCSVGPQVLETHAAGGVALTVENGHFAISNTVAIPVGIGGANVGTVIRRPLDPFPGEAYVAIVDGGLPGAPLSLLVDLAVPTPIAQWPTPVENFVLGVGTPGSTLALVDGIGVLGPPSPSVVFTPNPSNPALGIFVLSGFNRPASPLNLTAAMQVAWLDAAAPSGFRLGWTRIEQL